MSEATAREWIAETVKEAYDWGLSDATYNTNRAADRIIDIVREALLSEDAIEAACRDVRIVVPASEEIQLRGEIQVSVADIVRNALDAAFGPAK